VTVIILGDPATADQAAADALGVPLIARTGDDTLSERVERKLGRAAGKIAVLISDEAAVLNAEISKDLSRLNDRNEPHRMPSYVGLDPKLAPTGKNFDLNSANFLRSIIQGQPGTVIAGFGGNDALFPDVQRELLGVGFFRVITSVLEALGQIFEAIKQTSTSA